MPQPSFWKQSRVERAATLDAVFDEVQPADVKGPTAKSQLRLIQTLIVKKRAQGYTHEQIAERLKDARIGIDVTPVYIRKILREAAEQREKRRKARFAATIEAVRKLTPSPGVVPQPAKPPGTPLTRH